MLISDRVVRRVMGFYYEGKRVKLISGDNLWDEGYISYCLESKLTIPRNWCACGKFLDLKDGPYPDEPVDYDAMVDHVLKGGMARQGRTVVRLRDGEIYSRYTIPKDGKWVLVPGIRRKHEGRTSDG